MRVELNKRIIFIGTLLFLFSCTKPYSKKEIDKLFEPIRLKYGIRIVYELESGFEPITRGGDQAEFSKIEPIDYRILARYKKYLHEAFSKYPKDLITNHLKYIYFAKTMAISGFRCGGTYDQFRKIVYLANNGSLEDNRAIANFHHEFSSILLSCHGFFLNSWVDHNPKNFEYLQEQSANWTAIWKDIEYTGEGTEADYRQGFMNNYSRTNFENDFNEYAAMIFTHPQKFKKIMNQYPRVRGKFLVFLEFYHKIDPIFTEEYLLGEK
jgi:hypothetical protein